MAPLGQFPVGRAELDGPRVPVALGRLQAPPDVASWFLAALDANRFRALSISVPHATQVESLPLHHRDPFDRLLIAQARSEDLWLLTGDAGFERYDVRVIRC